VKKITSGFWFKVFLSFWIIVFIFLIPNENDWVSICFTNILFQFLELQFTSVAHCQLPKSHIILFTIIIISYWTVKSLNFNILIFASIKKQNTISIEKYTQKYKMAITKTFYRVYEYKRALALAIFLYLYITNGKFYRISFTYSSRGKRNVCWRKV